MHSLSFCSFPFQTSFAPVPPALLAHVVRGQIEAAFNPPEQEWGTRLLPGA